MEGRKILFFDGECIMCNWFADLLIKWDKNNILKLSTLQSKTARQLLSIEFTENVNTLVYLDNGKLYQKSTASLRALSDLGGLKSVFLVLLLVPRIIRDGVYNIFSRNRYKWFGRSETCRIPTSAERNKILE